MKLSMWMIANRLHNLDVLTQIDETDSVCLKSARLVHSPDCVYVYEENNRVIYQSSSGKIIIPDMRLSEGFDLLQNIFDFYDEWYQSIKELAAQEEFQQIIDRSDCIFRNPLVILDENNQVKGIREYPDPTIINEEWAYLQQYRCSSVSAVRMIRKNHSKDAENSFRSFGANSKGLKGQLLCYQPKLNGDIVYRINQIAYEREMNQGDRQLMELLGNVLVNALQEKKTRQTKADHFITMFDKILHKKKVPLEVLESRLQYLGWEMKDCYQVILFVPTLADKPEQLLKTMERMLKTAYPENIVLREESSFFLITDISKNKDFRTERLKSYFRDKELFIFSSYIHQGIDALPYQYRQTQKLYKIVSSNKSAFQGNQFGFYPFAFDYMLLASDPKEIYYASHPDIRYLWKREEDHKDELYETYVAYVGNNCSLKETAEYLHIHRNTLLYRIKKAESLIKFMETGDKAYDRAYFLTSARVLSLLKDKSITKIG